MPVRKLSAEDLRWVVCPVCRAQLALEAESIKCMSCGRRYPIVDGLPVLLASAAL